MYKNEVVINVSSSSLSYTHVKTHCLFLLVDRLEYGWAGHLGHGCWQACSCMLEQTVHGLMNKQTWTMLLNMLSGNVEITILNSDVTTSLHELGCCIKSGSVCSNKREQPLSICQAVYNTLKHDWTILLFYQSCSIMLTVFLQGCWANNPVVAWDIFTHVYKTRHCFMLTKFAWNKPCNLKVNRFTSCFNIRNPKCNVQAI